MMLTVAALTILAGWESQHIFYEWVLPFESLTGKGDKPHDKTEIDQTWGECCAELFSMKPPPSGKFEKRN
jgi:hypothetical protein